MTLRGVLGTGPVLIALAIVILAQLAFTFLPVLQGVSDTRPLSIVEGAVILALGAAMFAILEAEKLIMRRFGVS